MALNIKNREVERLAAEVAEMTRETKTQAILTALAQRKARLQAHPPARTAKDLQKFLERHIWPLVPPEVRGKTITKKEEEDILGLGPHGY